MVTWATAFVAVFSFYAHAAFGAPSSLTTPIAALVIAACLGFMALMGVAERYIDRTQGAARQMSIICLAAALALFVLSQCTGFHRRGMGVNDWGLFAVEAGLPFLLFLNPRRLELLVAMATCCVIFALLDFAANLVSAVGIAQLARHAGQAGSRSYGLHWLGLAGNSDAAGLVAFVAVSFLAALRGGGGAGRALRVAMIGALLASLVLIGARRYLGMAVVATPLLWFRVSARIPLPIVVAAFAAVCLAATFTADHADLDNHLRADLMTAGLADALEHPVLGDGAFYRNTTDLTAAYDQLRGAGVTESGALDLARQYGIPAAALFILSSLFALGAWRPGNTWPAVMLAMLTAELAFGDDLAGIPGAILFYTALIWVQREEGREEGDRDEPDPARRDQAGRAAQWVDRGGG